eukprot:CAMPEP_0172159530 /NCGR_PEP_ID=MMETSP1050-20130122/5022_1 /TAXON_ID=233186 /ORGANISM="Cryptomonas curvata, Strain CCAP979/52" /LENGTH=218 /DNA_ID=CAMNT_0012829129 /DNA_START=31 /DNA_END=684 /DNA_ORIENTATION=+
MSAVKEQMMFRFYMSFAGGVALAVSLVVLSIHMNNSSLSEKGQNLQYNLAFAKANLAADEVEVKNSIARLKEMDSLLHSSRKGARTASVDQLRRESSVLSDQSNQYKADLDESEMKMAKDLQSHSAAKIAEAKRLQIEEQDDQLLSRVLDRKAAKVKVELRKSKDMALAMERYPGKQQLLVGAMKELKHLHAAKEDLQRDATKVKRVLGEIARGPAAI